MTPRSHLSCGWLTVFDGLLEKVTSEGQAGTSLAMQLAGRAIKTSLWTLSHRDVLGFFFFGGGGSFSAPQQWCGVYPRDQIRPPSITGAVQPRKPSGRQKNDEWLWEAGRRCKQPKWEGELISMFSCFTCRHLSRSHMTAGKPSCGLESWKTTSICLDEAAANDGAPLQRSRMTRSRSIVGFFSRINPFCRQIDGCANRVQRGLSPSQHVY